ncbi:MAG: hypothetical protein HY272_10100 [Gammaproteobacteria bacterium]|nr:hypothetical protein [Gammaproteobacteria bacterium]
MEHHLTDTLTESRYKDVLIQAKSLLALTEQLVQNPYLLKTQGETILALSLVIHDLQCLVTTIDNALEATPCNPE